MLAYEPVRLGLVNRAVLCESKQKYRTDWSLRVRLYRVGTILRILARRHGGPRMFNFLLTYGFADLFGQNLE